MAYMPYIAAAAAFAALFIKARGFFRESAVYLLHHFQALKMYTTESAMTRALAILFAANMLGALLTWQAKESDTAARGYLLRNEYGDEDGQAALTVNLSGTKQDVELSVPARKLSADEIRQNLADAAELLPGLLLGDMTPDHVDMDLVFPEKAGDLPVRISWDTGDPLVIDWDGLIGPDVPEAGADVTLTAFLSCEDEERTEDIKLRVFPRNMTPEEYRAREIAKAVRDANDETEEKVTLPETVGGEEAAWSMSSTGSGVTVLLFGILIAVMYLYSRVRLREIETAAREEKMMIDYPNIVSKLVLLISAGMSLRRAFARIRKDYRESLGHGGEERPGYEEIVRMSLEMEHGVSELEAYEHLGKRIRVPAYRTFSTLLVQNLTKGGGEMAAILGREAEEAYEERKKRARILGEEAGTKLLLPMLLMLVIVMAILMVPAFFAFF